MRTRNLADPEGRCILLPYEPIAIGQESDPLPDGTYPELKLWGLTLGMTLDMLTHMSHISSDMPTNASTYPDAIRALTPKMNDMPPLPPSTATIFPQFVYPDINFLIWVFGYRYRRVARMQPADTRVNWAGMSLGHYYAAVRRALIFAVLLRAIAGALGITFVVKVLKRWHADRRMLS